MGYVGLPLAAEFAKKKPVIGFDINEERIKELQKGYDRTQEISNNTLANLPKLQLTSHEKDLAKAQIYIVTVPTPIDQHNQPDLTPLKEASKTIGKYLKQQDVVIYESTVYPGATEKTCVPILEKTSKLQYNIDFFCGYSPERINPGDKSRPINQILKITSGSTPQAAAFIDKLYQEIIEAGTYPVASIQIAEAAKAIENTQRDLNIALINEFAIIFNRLNIDTEAVLKAAGTKWNFLPFKPGLVGGHCLSVDPYYLTYCAQSIGYHPEIILAGRRLNDQMGTHIASQLIKKMSQSNIQISQSRVLVMGLTFKENCCDIRNTRVIDIIRELQDHNIIVDVIDPNADPLLTQQTYQITLIDQPKTSHYDAIILAVSHQSFIDMGCKAIRSLGKSNHVFFDVKHAFSVDESDIRL